MNLPSRLILNVTQSSLICVVLSRTNAAIRSDRIKWRKDLVEDRDRLSKLYESAQQVNPERDAKLADLRRIVADKCSNQIGSHQVAERPRRGSGSSVETV